jgi:hypothetical protein
MPRRNGLAVADSAPLPQLGCKISGITVIFCRDRI